MRGARHQPSAAPGASALQASAARRCLLAAAVAALLWLAVGWAIGGAG